jgi:hypothetical protein
MKPAVVKKVKDAVDVKRKQMTAKNAVGRAKKR